MIMNKNLWQNHWFKSVFYILKRIYKIAKFTSQNLDANVRRNETEIYANLNIKLWKISIWWFFINRGLEQKI